MDQNDRYIDRVKHLPPAPTLVVELLDLFKEPDRDLDRVVELITHEPALTAEILKQCNSAYFAGDEPISDMFTAVTRLGFYEVYSLVVGLFGARTMSMPGVATALPPDQLWEHSVKAAAAAAAIARQTEEIEATAFTSGLLHDIGKLVLAAAESQGYAGPLQASGGSGLALIEAEQAAFTTDHAQVGARLLERWKLPAAVVTAVRCHHQPAASGEHQRLTTIVHLANTLAHHLGDNPEDAAALVSAMESPAGGDFETLGLSPENFTEIVQDAHQAFERVKGLMPTRR